MGMPVTIEMKFLGTDMDSVLSRIDAILYFCTTYLRHNANLHKRSISTQAVLVPGELHAHGEHHHRLQLGLVK